MNACFSDSFSIFLVSKIASPGCSRIEFLYMTFTQFWIILTYMHSISSLKSFIFILSSVQPNDNSIILMKATHRACHCISLKFYNFHCYHRRFKILASFQILLQVEFDLSMAPQRLFSLRWKENCLFCLDKDRHMKVRTKTYFFWYRLYRLISLLLIQFIFETISAFYRSNILIECVCFSRICY